MRYFDTAKICIKAGDGGDGVVAFRREKCAPPCLNRESVDVWISLPRKPEPPLRRCSDTRRTLAMATYGDKLRIGG
jgi:hypothetical protein